MVIVSYVFHWLDPSFFVDIFTVLVRSTTGDCFHMCVSHNTGIGVPPSQVVFPGLRSQSFPGGWVVPQPLVPCPFWGYPLNGTGVLPCPPPGQDWGVHQLGLGYSPLLILGYPPQLRLEYPPWPGLRYSRRAGCVAGGMPLVVSGRRTCYLFWVTTRFGDRLEGSLCTFIIIKLFLQWSDWLIFSNWNRIVGSQPIRFKDRNFHLG